VCNALGALPGAPFDALTRLEQLNLARNRLRSLPASIANLSALNSLNLDGNRIGAKGAQALMRPRRSASLACTGVLPMRCRIAAIRQEMWRW
jgi:hypothetical protein